ncbi:hypothetical protein BGM26_04445 [Bacillus sp. FJAT-29790]|uniref:hypothetical protein n=1 Tax=Bacillus sp. FJAT-29790 TaxID=1895002 RepID=UPI001C222F0D|nr:hypothetical protein [Bacillus sp. FJAT-29790]MBU8878239.1 hypothetical protein [Bacillus sp. FJAT-29790]
MIGGLVWISYTNSLFDLIGAGLVFGVGFGSIQPSLQAWTISLVAPNHRGSGIAALLLATDLGIGLGSMLLGVIAAWTSYAMMYRLSALSMVLFLGVYGYYLTKQKAHTLTTLH